MAELRAGIIGCGRVGGKTAGATGAGQAHHHVRGYASAANVRLAALADIVEENAAAFQRQYGGDVIYTDYRQMLEKERLDIVSICTWTILHEEMVLAAAAAGVKAIYCEKPMAPTYGAAKRMLAACEEQGVMLVFNHQRRFNEPFIKARQLLRDGAIGQLQRIEGACSNLFDWGTHWFDMMFFYNDQAPATWVIGQVDTRNTRYVFGAPCESQGVSHIRFANGVHGLMTTGFENDATAENRLIGSDGIIEVGAKTPGATSLRVWGKGQRGWTDVPTSEGIHDNSAVARGIADMLDALHTGREPELSARRALQATELIFATYESSRRRGRVDLPLTIDDSPLIDMLGN